MFVLLTLSFLVVSIVIIRFLCHRMGAHVKTLSLVLAAFLAACMVGLAITLGTYLDAEQYIRLGVLALVASLLVTAVNEYLLKREKKPKEWETQVLPWEELENIELSPLPRTPAGAEDAAQGQTGERASPSEGAAEPTENASAAMLQGEVPVEATESAEEPPAEAAASSEEPGPGQIAAPAEAGKSAITTSAAEAADAGAAKAAEPEESEESKEAPATAEAGDAAETTAGADAAVPEDAEPPTLDELLDIAYAKRTSDMPAAIAAYREAIDRFPDDDYTPFLVIELAGLYKDSADYKGAIALYKKALDLPIIAQNEATVEEFQKSIRYLGIVSDILAKHHAEGTPYPAIPEPLRQAIETAFGAD